MRKDMNEINGISELNDNDVLVIMYRVSLFITKLAKVTKITVVTRLTVLTKLAKITKITVVTNLT